MAKQMVGPFERHVEKAILAVTGILFIGSAAMYLVSSPNEIELGGETVTPGTIDAKLSKRALSVRSAIRQAQSDSPDVKPLAPGFEAGLDPFRGGQIPLTLPSAGSIGPHVPVADPASAAPGQRSLVTIAPLGQPSATNGRSTFVFLDNANEEAFSIANWVTVSALFDVQDQMALQQAEYGASRKDVFFGPPQLQRRAQRADGSWSDDDWNEVESWPASGLRPLPKVLLIADGDDMAIDPESTRDLGRYTDDLIEPMQQLEVLRPLLPDIQNGDGWSFPVLVSYRDVVIQDQEFLFPEDPEAEQLDRYGIGEEVAIGGHAEAKLTFAERRKRHEAAHRRLMESAKKNRDEDIARRAYNEGQAIFTDAEAGAADKTKATKMMKEAVDLEYNIERRKKQGGRGGRRGVQGGGPRAAQLVRQTQPTQQLWSHDAGPGKVESGKTYQYRMRPTVLNGLVGEPQKFREKENAARVLIPGAWTEPVEVAIPVDTMFFLTSKNKGKGTAKFQFYKWEEGKWVESRRFAFSVGDELRGESRVKLPSPDDPTIAYSALVDFEVDGMIIDIDFDRTYRERKKVSSSRTGVKFAGNSKACSVVFVDGSGRLHERFVKTDKANPERKNIKGQVWPKK